MIPHICVGADAVKLCRNGDLVQTLQHCVLPLAGDKAGALFTLRHAGITELGNLANALGTKICIHNVHNAEFTKVEGDYSSKVVTELLSHGGHFDVLYR